MTIFLLLLFFLPVACLAQDADSTMRHGHDVGRPELTTLALEARVALEQDRVENVVNYDNTGFKGQYFNLRLDGQIVNGLTFSYRQRLNKPTDRTFWDATDWLHLDWRANEHWSVSAGKQIVAIGGFEYDLAPIDLYYCSEFWNQIACYQLGVSATYRPRAKDALVMQVCNSPFRTWAGNDTYAFNLLWQGRHGMFESLWSLNVLQEVHEAMVYISLGNRFHLTDRLYLDVDWMNRASSKLIHLNNNTSPDKVYPKSFWSDGSVMTSLNAEPWQGGHVFVKYTYDWNNSGTDDDLTVYDGTRMHMLSAGVEYHPVRKYREALRLFAAAGYNWGENTNADGVKRDGQLMVQAGVKFRLDVLQALHNIFKL